MYSGEEMFTVQTVHHQRKHPRGSSPHLETDHTSSPESQTSARIDISNSIKTRRIKGYTHKMNEATHDDAVNIARALNVNKESVWEIIKGMQYSTYSELAMAVQRAFSC